MGAQTRSCVALLGLFIFVFGVMGRHWRNVLSLRALARQSSGMESFMILASHTVGCRARPMGSLAMTDRDVSLRST